MRKYFLLISSIFVVLLFSGCGSESNEAKTIIEDNTSFDELKAKSNKTFTLNTTTGESIILNLDNGKLTSKRLNGKVVLLNFWATWCPPCIEEMPTFNSMYEKYGDQFEIVGVLFEKDKNMDELAAFMKKHKMKFPVTVGEENFRLADYYDEIKRVPESYVYDKDGSFLKKFVGVVDEKELEAFITK